MVVFSCVWNKSSIHSHSLDKVTSLVPAYTRIKYFTLYTYAFV